MDLREMAAVRAELMQELAELERDIGDLVVSERHSGTSWSEIAEQLYVTKQAAQQRYGKLPLFG